jgi:hypothetical protein
LAAYAASGSNPTVTGYYLSTMTTSPAPTVTNSGEKAVEGSTAKTATFWKDTAGWSDEIWSFKNGEYPVLKGFAADGGEIEIGPEGEGITIIVPEEAILEDGTLILPEGNIILPGEDGDDDDITITVPEWTIIDLDEGTITLPEGEITLPGEGENGEITITVPNGTTIDPQTGTVTLAAGNITAGGNTISVTQGTTIEPKAGTVTVGDVVYNLYTGELVPSTAKAITAFSLAGEAGTIDEGAGTIAVTVPYGTNIISIAPAITHTGVSIDPAAGVPQNFTSPVTYTVTAAEDTTSDWTASVTSASRTAKAITAFSLAGEAGTIDEGAGTIAVTVQYGTDDS